MARHNAVSRYEAGEPLSLDSLLDTLMCVVGVSLVLLAAAQLQLLKVKHARVTDAIPADIARLLETEQKRQAQQTDRLKELQATWNGRVVETHANDKERRELQVRLAGLQDEPDRLQKLQARLAEAYQVEKNLGNELSTLTTAIQDLRGEIDQLQQVIANAEPPTTIRLPVQRVLKKALDPVRFICRYGKVYPLDSAQLIEAFNKAQKIAVASITPNMSFEQSIRQVISHFDHETVGNRYFRIKLRAVVDDQEFAGFMIETIPKKDQGELLDDVLKPTSQVVKALKRVDPSKQYVRFMVWSDSFDHYLAFRQKVEELHAAKDSINTRIGLSWMPYAHDEELQEFWDVLKKYQDHRGGKEAETIIDN